MKWSEFKVIVEDALAGQDPDIAYIDADYPYPGCDYLIDIYDHEGRLCIYSNRRNKWIY